MSNIDICREKLVKNGMRVYQANPTLMFALTEEKVLVMTSFHTFFLRHTHRNFIPRLRRIRTMIEQDQIHSAADLISELKLDVGEGVEMVVTKLSYHLGDIK